MSSLVDAVLVIHRLREAVALLRAACRAGENLADDPRVLAAINGADDLVAGLGVAH